MNQSFDVIVIGAGIVGISAAIAMSQRNFSVALLDAGSLKVDTQAIDARVYAINRASQSLFQSLGVWELLDSKRLSPYKHMHVWDAANGSVIDFDARMIATDRLGTIIEESIIKQGLLEQAAKQTIVSFPSSKISEIHPTADGIVISDGTRTWQTKLLIGADGAASATRQLLGVSLTSWSYHQQAIVTTVSTEKPHQQTAYQVFNADGPLAFLPLADPHQCSIVWSTKVAKAQALMELGDEAFAQALGQAFASKLGDCTLIGKRYAFPLHMRHTQQYSGPHWLLIGDAAHTIHPLAGLGLNVGLADLSAWLAILDTDTRKTWSNKTLKAYQRERKYALWQIISLMEGLKAIFANPLPPVTALRGIGLGFCNRLLPLKRIFINQAAN